AFTGAVDFKEGLVKAADNGTFFIDEIADMNLVVQASLLRFIETGVFRSIGSNREVKVRTRIVAAINRNIEEEVRAKRFRHDLYYRLNVCRIHIPPLRERPEDIPVLVRHFLASYAASTGREVVLSTEAIERLAWHTWPGNVRELFHTLQRVLVMLNSGENSISKNDVETALKSHTGTSVRDLRPVTSLDETEKRYILASLNAHNWNISRTATVLGIDRRTLQRKISRYHISR
ncbi:MAG: sigma-54-dependent Fis family transcriptional regulator, partial [Deltaproteobacteria bacterium]|nr:sigma-54-dependent Fis family transcriptional regulator [Deltaproteobacteria bacterium]